MTDPYSPAENRDLAGKRCLVVDNNKASKGVLEQLLVSFGLTVEAPEDFSLAFAIAVDAFEAKKPFDVILVDAVRAFLLCGRSFSRLTSLATQFLPDVRSCQYSQSFGHELTRSRFQFGAQTLLRRLRQRGIDAAAIALTRMGSPIHEVLRSFDCKCASSFPPFCSRSADARFSSPDQADQAQPTPAHPPASLPRRRRAQGLSSRSRHLLLPNQSRCSEPFVYPLC